MFRNTAVKAHGDSLIDYFVVTVLLWMIRCCCCALNTKEGAHSTNWLANQISLSVKIHLGRPLQTRQ